MYLSAAEPARAGLAGNAAAPNPGKVARAEAELRDVAAHSTSTRERALAAFVLGQGEAERKQTEAAAHDLTVAATWAPVRDAATAELVKLWASVPDDARTLAAAERYPVAKGDVFTAAIGKPAARAAAHLQAWKAARAWAGRFPRDPEMLWILAQAESALGNALAAGEAERTIFYEFPAAPVTKLAGAAYLKSLAAMARLAPSWQMEVRRAEEWTAAGQDRKAAGRFVIAASMAPRRERGELEAREVRAWAAAGDVTTARKRLQALLRGSERAQGLEIEVEMARRTGDTDAMNTALATLLREYHQGRWTAVALRLAGDEATLQFDDTTTQKRFDELVRLFPHAPGAAAAAWRAAWIAFRLDQPDTPQRLEDYLRAYPHGQAVPDAIFWRGIWAERHKDPALAAMCLATVARSFPGTFFGQQAEARTHEPTTETAYAVAAPAWLRRYQHAQPRPEARPVPKQFQADIRRAEWMGAAGLLDPAAAILNHVLYELPPGEASLGVARQVGTIEAERKAWNLGLTAMMRAVPQYAELQPDQLRASDWKLLFPAPYAADIAATAKEFGLDRFLVLGLIRQESGFNASAVSYAHARGLMQLELGTARHRLEALPVAWQRLKGPGRLSASDLLKPSLNLALGTAELSSLLTQFNNTAYALAGYNAGSHRVVQWQEQFSGLALDAFIESVPFTQTRNYIQAVLRNAEHYREIYGHY